MLNVPTGATTGPLTVTTPRGTSAASSQSFTVVPPPVIISFAPLSGPIGTSVTITGTGFDAVASQNVVFFGATQAAVTAASPTSLTVSVPLGATYQYPSVTNLTSALTAYAGQPFVVTLNGAVAFAPKADFATGKSLASNPASVSIGDVDGDGKPDLAVLNYNDGTVSVLLNTGTAGTASFATTVDFGTGTGHSSFPRSVSIGDVDGDGQPDLVVANGGSGMVSVLRQVAPLPVELTTFTATAEGPAAVGLAWTTASEKNSQAFEVERSVDGTSFAHLGTVAAAGSSSNARSYGFVDAKLPGGAALLYYRLRQVDLDGTFSYSPVRTVTPGKTSADAGLALFPNPAHAGTATLTGALPGTVVTVFDALGRLVTSATANATGTAALELPAGLAIGVYVVRAGGKALRLIVN